MQNKLDISVLYVEDEPAVRNSIARTLMTVCDNITLAENGKEALAKLREVPIDLIITDIRMPEMNGLEFVKKIREEGMEIPVVITSAFNDIEYFQHAIDLKVEKFINKPIRIADLIDLVVRLAETITMKRTLLSRQQELEHYREAIDTTNLVIRVNGEGEVIFINSAMEYFISQIDKNIASFDVHALFLPEIFEELLRQTKQLNIFHKTTALKYVNNIYTVQMTAFPSVLHHNIIEEITIILNDLSPIVQEKDNLIQTLFTDMLTGLPNRQKLFSDLEHTEADKAMMILDIENFSEINYLYGFELGDAILRHVANILLDYWPDERSRTVYRSDTDHFVILTDKMKDFNRDKMMILANNIIKKIEESVFIFKNVMLDISVTAGGSCNGEHDIYSEALMALSVAKAEHKPFLCYSELNGLKEQFNVNITMQSTIKKAIDNDLIVNYYQPVVNSDKQIVKYEALIRMIDPKDATRVFTPYQFLEIAKQSKNYALLTKRVISNAFNDFGDGKMPVAINLSFDDIINPEIYETLEKHVTMFPDANITLELLESEGLKDIQKTIAFCQQMKEYGMSIAIDDFGSGYSNFVNLFDIPLDVLKIDGSLVRRVNEERGHAILQSIVNFSEYFGFSTVAEYVENEIYFEKLKSLGIHNFQGYYISEPKPYEML